MLPIDVAILIGRILFALLFVDSGINHIRQRGRMAGFAGSKGIPAPSLLVPLTGIQLIVGAALLVLGVWPDLGALLIAAFLAPTALTMHAYWTIDDPQQRHGDRIHFLKDVALLGAALMLLGLFSQAGDDLGLTITGPLF